MNDVKEPITVKLNPMTEEDVQRILGQQVMVIEQLKMKLTEFIKENEELKKKKV